MISKAQAGSCVANSRVGNIDVSSLSLGRFSELSSVTETSGF